MGVTTAIILDSRRARKDETYPVKLRVTFNRVRKYYSIIHPQKKTAITLTTEDFKKVIGEKPRQEFKELKMVLHAIEQRALDTINELSTFSFHLFESYFIERKQPSKNIETAFSRYIDELSLQGRAGTAASYQCALNSLTAFKTNISLDTITVPFLQNYEEWMLKEGNSLTTIGIYLRSLRTIMNIAIAEGVIKEHQYPFGKKKYSIPTGHNVKKAMSKSDVQKMLDYIPEPDSSAERAKDFWFFSYLCNGINMKDIAMLKYSNIEGDYLRFVRQKTKNITRSNPKVITCYLNEYAKEIIRKWGTKPKKKENYIFPIITEGITAERQLRLVQQFVKQTNKWIGQIAAELEIEKVPTTYTARHTFATVLKRSGVSKEFIGEALGHHSLHTTESYLDSFEDEAKKEVAGLLLDFGSTK